MINFFRKIRQKMADDNKPLKYMRYAIGEILLVVIGILIALQVNNLNEQRKERIQENIYLKRFEVELVANLENILNAISLNEGRIKRAEFLLRVIDRPHLAEDSASYFIKSIEHAGYTNIPQISDNAFEELKSSGKLSLISNEALRIALQKYYSWTSDEQYNFLQQDVQLTYSHNRQGILTTSQVIDMGDYNTTKHYDAVEGKKAFQRMINKRVFLEFLPYVIQNKLITATDYDDIYTQAKKLKKMVDSELDKQKQTDD